MLRNVLLIIACQFLGFCLARESGIPHDDLIKDIFQTMEYVPPGFVQPSPKTTTVLHPYVDSRNSAKYKSCGHKKQCLPRYLCKDSAVNMDGTGLFDFRMDAASVPQNNTCRGIDVCCDIPSKTTAPVITSTPTISTFMDPHVYSREPIKFKSCGQEKQCVPRYLCRDSTVIEGDMGLVEKNECEHLGVCCHIPKKVREGGSEITEPQRYSREPIKFKSCGHEKQCVPRYLCKDTSVIEGDTVFFENNECGQLGVCCNIPSKTTDPIKGAESHWRI